MPKKQKTSQKKKKTTAEERRRGSLDPIYQRLVKRGILIDRRNERRKKPVKK